MFQNIWNGLGELLSWLLPLWPIFILAFFALGIWALVSKGGKGIIAAFAIISLIIPLGGLAARWGVRSAGHTLGMLETVDVPQARQESGSLDHFLNGVESVQETGSLCAIAPSFCEKNDAGSDQQSSQSSNGQNYPQYNGEQNNSSNGNSQQSSIDGQQQPSQPQQPVSVWVPMEGEQLNTCVTDAYGALRVQEGIATYRVPYQVRIDGNSPSNTDWAHYSSQIILIKVTRGTNHYRLYNPFWPGFVQIDTKVGKNWEDLGSEIATDSAEALILNMGGVLPKAIKKAWVVQGTGDWPHDCYVEVVIEPELTEVPVTDETSGGTDVTTYCSYPGQDVAGVNLYTWVGSVPTGEIRNLNPGIEISVEGNNPDAVPNIIWPIGHSCPP